jgi:hypothetical protein
MRPVSAAVLACVLLPLSLAVAACEPRTVTDTSRKIYCEVMPDAPERDNDDDPKKIIGKVRFRCDQPGAASMALSIHLQRRNTNGDWIDVVATSFTVSAGETTSTRDETFRTRELQATCGDGVYRMYVNGSSTARGVTKTYDRPGPRAFEPCRAGLFAGDN